jgi:SAM-dependent methyltransferase
MVLPEEHIQLVRDRLEAEKGAIGRLINRADLQLVDLIAQRMKLALRIEEIKRGLGEEIVRATVETSRLDTIAKIAEQRGLNPNFARALLYFIIGESCKRQFMQLQSPHGLAWEDLDEDNQYEALKESLLKLTAAIASRYDVEYVRRPSATYVYLHCEKEFIRNQLRDIPDRSLAIDIGCATGHKSFKLLQNDFGDFRKVIGYDISPAMIQHAREKAKALGIGDERVKFVVADADNELPIADDSVSFVVINLGTASDIRNISRLISEIRRVLVPGGKAFFSFYNREALLYQLGFLPWSVSLAAEIDLRRHCLNVHAGDQIYQVYARAYSVQEVIDLMQKDLEILEITTYPTVCSILPSTIFEEKIITKLLEDVDHAVAGLNLGAYIMVCVRKRD